jgi:branched-chain amino acid transport system permease protein
VLASRRAVAIAAVATTFVVPSSSLATEVLVFAIAAMACNLLLGYTGLLSFGQGIFFGVGAYTASLAVLRAGAGLATCLAVALAAGAVAAAFVGALSIRRRGVYFVMLTLAFAQLAYFVAYTGSSVTGGENGLLDVHRPALGAFGVALSLRSTRAYYVAVALVFLAVFFGLQRVTRSPFGSTLVAIRDNEERAIAVGYHTRLYKIVAFAISGAVTAVAGALYAMSLQFAPLSNIDVAMSEQILITTIIGGTGSLLGSVLGAVFYVVVGDALASIWPRWMLLLGLLLIAIVMFMRRGLWGALESLVGLVRARRPGGAAPAEPGAPPVPKEAADGD